MDLDGTDGRITGFKKNVNRATTQVMMKTGHVEKTNDRDYEVEERWATIPPGLKMHHSSAY
ncbi:hypothetical protein LZ32DRAFT_601689 [Colletotrichum eremochloae]|nr:hypothetical protein LZ32DRAFT_601689 [Colletotrichum eremochloae]